MPNHIHLTTLAPLTIVTVELPNPLLGDTDQLNIQTKFKLSMAGTAYSYLNTPSKTKFLLHFAGISTAKIAALITVIETAVNGLCTYTDYDDVSHTVKIMNNPFERSADGRAPCVDPADWNEKHSFTLELEIV